MTPGSKKRKHYFESEHQPESEDYEPYWCIICGKREDEEKSDIEKEDIQEIEESWSGIVFRSNSGEPTASETYVCQYCRKRYIDI